MSEGHTHREVRVPPMVERVLTVPLFHTTNAVWADRSRMVFKPGRTEGEWALSALGILHGLTGLTLDTSPKEQQ